MPKRGGALKLNLKYKQKHEKEILMAVLAVVAAAFDCFAR